MAMTSMLLPAPSGTELRIFGWKGVLPRLPAPAGNCPSFAVGPHEGSAAAAACRARFRRWSRRLDPARRWWRCAGLLGGDRTALVLAGAASAVPAGAGVLLVMLPQPAMASAAAATAAIFIDLRPWRRLP